MSSVIVSSSSLVVYQEIGKSVADSLGYKCIGQDIVADVLSATGHKVTDLSSNLEPEDILKQIKKGGPGMLVITSLVPVSLRLARDVSKRTRTCRKAVKELMALLKREGYLDRLEVVLVGFAFNQKFAREIGSNTVCRDLSSVFLEFHQRTAKARRR